MLRARVVISALAYDLVWEAERLGDQHNALITDSPGSTWEERIEVAKRVLGELTAAGLADGTDVRPDLVAALRLLARPQREVYGWFSPDAQAPPVGVLAATAGTDAVLAILHDGWLTLEPVDPDRLPEAVARLLPECPPLRTPVLSFPQEEQAGRSTAEGPVLRPAGGPRGHAATAERARRLFAQSKLGAGQFRVASRTPRGSREIAEFPLDYVDTAAGRYLSGRQRGPDGAVWSLVLPGGPRELTDRLRAQFAGPLVRLLPA
ncbi:ESX secretion-associated protein EspG [Crossiella sp. CA198]|uniref:ESX secretion-associated protein EspG n=1 Tax=Crossiella sp. CA198 TaxID=3455607 RepID=UPI003F8D34F0